MQVVERRLEQAAEAVEPRRERRPREVQDGLIQSFLYSEDLTLFRPPTESLAMNIKISALRIFIAVVEAGNIHDAANKVCRSASAVSTALKLLEEEIGGALFETDRKNRLTALGKYLYDTAVRQVDGYEKALLNVRAFALGHLGQARAAFIPSVATSLMPAALGAFRQDNPAVELELWDMDTATIARWVAEGKVDFGIGGAPDDPEINFEPLLADELVLVYPDRLAATLPEVPVDIHGLLALPCITNGVIAGSVDESLRRFHAASRLNVHNTSSLLTLVAAGVGLTILPRLSLAGGTAKIKICPLSLEHNSWQIGLITHPAHAMTAAAALFLNYFRDTVHSREGH